MDNRVLAIIFAFTLLLVTNSEKPYLSLPEISSTVAKIGGASPFPTASPTSPKISPSPSPVSSVPSLQAGSAGLFEMDSAFAIFQKNQEDPQPIASLTKLMTAVVALEELGEEAKITISSEDLLVESRHPNLAPGDIFTLKESLYFLLLPSDNAVAEAISHTATTKETFLRLMNIKARSLGMMKTSFSNSTGLNGNLSTPGDLFLLGRYILENHPSILGTSQVPEITLINKQGKTYRLKNTNLLLGKVPKILGGKTGYTPEAGGSLLLVFEAGEKKLLSVVLGSEDRFGDTEKLYRWYLINTLGQ
ncbi:MAG: D-alanyl-D-alanine carboxypeptidase [Parcubacteria group bacterium]|nr:D-alanyl-D-alanine carboxypeptidase [Parcubacteria group bacterium]